MRKCLAIGYTFYLVSTLIYNLLTIHLITEITGQNISITITFINRQKREVQPVIISLVQGLEDMRQHGGVLPARRGHRHRVASLEQFASRDRKVDLGFECPEETLLAQCIARFWTLKVTT